MPQAAHRFLVRFEYADQVRAERRPNGADKPSAAQRSAVCCTRAQHRPRHCLTRRNPAVRSGAVQRSAASQRICFGCTSRLLVTDGGEPRCRSRGSPVCARGERRARRAARTAAGSPWRCASPEPEPNQPAQRTNARPCRRLARRLAKAAPCDSCPCARARAVCMRCVCKLLCTRLFACASCGRQANGGARRWRIPEASSGRCRRLGTGAFPAPARRACSGKKNTIKLALVVASALPGCKAALVSCLTGDHNTQHTVRYDRQHAVHTRSHVARIIQPCRSAAQRASMARRTRGGGRVSQPAGSARTERRRPCQRRLGSLRATCAYRQAGSAAGHCEPG